MALKKLEATQVALSNFLVALEPINIAIGDENEKDLATRFSPAQKALYYVWYLDAEVTNGGFIQFYWNDYRKYIPLIIDEMCLCQLLVTCCYEQ